MKKKIAVLLALVLALGLTGCGANKEAADVAADAEAKTFTVGFDAEFPPYGYKDESGRNAFGCHMEQTCSSGLSGRNRIHHVNIRRYSLVW